MSAVAENPTSSSAAIDQFLDIILDAINKRNSNERSQPREGIASIPSHDGRSSDSEPTPFGAEGHNEVPFLSGVNEDVNYLDPKLPELYAKVQLQFKSPLPQGATVIDSISVKKQFRAELKSLKIFNG